MREKRGEGGGEDRKHIHTQILPHPHHAMTHRKGNINIENERERERERDGERRW